MTRGATAFNYVNQLNSLTRQTQNPKHNFVQELKNIIQWIEGHVKEGKVVDEQEADKQASNDGESIIGAEDRGVEGCPT